MFARYTERAELAPATVREYKPRIVQILDFFNKTEGIEPNVIRNFTNLTLILSGLLQDLTDLWSGRLRLLPTFSKFPLKTMLSSPAMQQHATNAFTAMCRVRYYH